MKCQLPTQQNNHRSSTPPSKNIKKGFPLRTTFSIAVIVLWNLLLIPFFSDFILGAPNADFKPQNALLPLCFLFFTCVLTLTSKKFQKIVLKEGSHFHQIKPFVYLLLVITTIMIFGFSVFSFFLS